MNRQPADLRRRIGAYLLDSVIAAAISGIGAGIFAGISVGTAGAFPLPVALVLASLVPLAWLLVYSAMQGGDGSLGMRMLGLELRHADDDGALGFGRALGRNLVWGVGAAVIVGMFSPLFDRSPWRRGWHDIAVGSVMIDALGAPAAAAPAAAEDVPAPLPIPPMAGFPSAAAAASLPVTPVAPPASTIAPASPVRPAETTPVATTVSAPAAGGVISFVPGVSQQSAKPVAAPAPATIAPPAVPLDDTRMATGERALATMVWDDGTRQAVYGTTLFGRNPTPETGVHVAPIRDETLSLSKTHFEIGAEDGRLFALDRHSTNGVVVRRGAQRQTLVAGQRTPIHAGDVLEMGDRHVTVEVAR